MSILTEEMELKAAKVIYGEIKSRNNLALNWEELGERHQGEFRNEARAALESALPLIVEECAKVAAMRDVEGPADDQIWAACAEEAKEIAAEIRSLVTSNKGE